MCSRVSYNIFHYVTLKSLCNSKINYSYRESASCTHISALLHALVAMRYTPSTSASVDTSILTADDSDDSDVDNPVTSYPCKWKAP